MYFMLVWKMNHKQNDLRYLFFCCASLSFLDSSSSVNIFYVLSLFFVYEMFIFILCIEHLAMQRVVCYICISRKKNVNILKTKDLEYQHDSISFF